MEKKKDCDQPLHFGLLTADTHTKILLASFPTVHKWTIELKHGHRSIEDDPHIPKIAPTPQIIEQTNVACEDPSDYS